MKLHASVEKAKELYFKASSQLNFGAWFAHYFKDEIPQQHFKKISEAGTMKQALRTIKELGYE